MGFDADFSLTIGCFVPLKAANWPKLRRLFANPKLQQAISSGGASVLYPTTAINIAGASATDLDSAASTVVAAESVGGVAAEPASSNASSESHESGDDESVDSDRDADLDLSVNIISKIDDGWGTPCSFLLHENCERNCEVNAIMHAFFRSLPGFETDDDAPLTAAEHKAALSAFERRFTENADAIALVFEFPLLRQSISAKCENFESAKHMPASDLSEEMASCERQLTSFGFARGEICVRSNMRCG